jgi:hypothetical protein
MNALGIRGGDDMGDVSVGAGQDEGADVNAVSSSGDIAQGSAEVSQSAEHAEISHDQ